MKKYFKHKIENLLVVNKLVTVLYLQFDKDFKAKGETHDFWEIVYVEQGEIVCTAEEKTIVLKQGEMLFHKPNEFHALSANGKVAPNVFVITFECKSEAMNFFANKRLKPQEEHLKYIHMIISEAKKTFLIPYSDPTKKKYDLLPNPTLGGMQLIKNFLEILLINMMRLQTETRKGNPVFLQKNELDNRLVKEVITVLENGLYKKLCIRDICEQIFYSRTYIFKQFKINTGYSVMEYYIRLKIEKSKQLLRESTLTVTEISQKLSFDTPNYFTKTFKRHCGLTPSAYRKNTSDF